MTYFSVIDRALSKMFKRLVTSFVPARFKSGSSSKGGSRQETVYNLSGFNQYGLMLDDVIQMSDTVLKALDRLPQHKLDQRNYRLKRAMILQHSNHVLPKEEWMTLDRDERYLTPYIQDVMREEFEEIEWNKTH